MPRSSEQKLIWTKGAFGPYCPDQPIWMRKFLAARQLVVAVFCAICFLGGCSDIAVPDRNVFSAAAEQMRVTSPSGQLDAVLVRDPYGAAAGGGVDWNVYITTKGTP